MKHSITEAEDGALSLEERAGQIRLNLQQLASRGELGVPAEKALSLLEQMQEFELGRHLLLHGSLDGYWTRYCVYAHPKDRKRPGLHPLEDFLLNSNSVFLATQERFTVFQKQLQARLHDGMALASVPCGFMDDLLTLDFGRLSGMTLTGFDVDPKSCAGALENARQLRVRAPVETHCLDAWQVGRAFPAAFDALTSNGLNIYVAESEKETALYRSFAEALKKGGILIISFLTPPPYISAASPWKDYDPDSLALRKVVMSDIVGAKWQNYNTVETITGKLGEAGLKVVEIAYDSRNIFPTVVAEKR